MPRRRPRPDGVTQLGTGSAGGDFSALSGFESHEMPEKVLRAIRGADKPRKYRNQPVEYDGHRFASKRERDRYHILKRRQAAGEIRALECQPRYPLIVNGVRIGTYVADFVYALTDTGELVVEDAKGVRTREYVLKSKLLLALYGHQVREV